MIEARPSPAPGSLPVLPDGRAALALLKPITWFAPVWAFGCGAVASGRPWTALVPVGFVLAGPFLTGASQAINDWCDRHVDAINQPERPIPSGRLPGRTGLVIAVATTVASLALALLLGPIVLALAMIGVVLAIAYSAEPIRLKRNGWLGNGAVGLSYEGLPWIAGGALLLGHAPGPLSLVLAGLWSVGAHGIMTLNDFKSIEGDRTLGVRTLPVRLGVRNACIVACVTMALPQAAVVSLLAYDDRPWYAMAIAIALLGQIALMRHLLADPRGRAPWYNGTGTSLFVLSMLVAAFAARPGG